MNFKKLILIISIFFLSACNQFDQENKNLVYISDQKYSNTGFALIYDDELKKEKKISKKIDNRSLLIFHNKIKKNSFVKITNPVNDKSIIAEVISNNAKFSSFYNSVITQRIAEELSLDPKEPYIDLVLISKSSTFVAKKAKTFDEEKSVAEKAPVDGITIDNLGKEKNKEVKIKKHKLNQIIDRTKKGGAEIVKYLEKGSAFYAPAASGVEMAESYLKDLKKQLPCAAYLNGEYNTKELYAGVPVIIGAKGVEKIIELNLSSDEAKNFKNSIESVKELLSAAKKIDPELK